MKREGGLSPLLPPFLPSSVMVAVYLLFMMMDFVEEEEEKEGDREGERSEVRSDASESKVVHFTILGGGNREEPRERERREGARTGGMGQKRPSF